MRSVLGRPPEPEADSRARPCADFVIFLPRRFTLFTDGFPRVFLGKGLGYITACYSASVFFGHASPHINEKILAMPRDALGIILI